VFRTSGLVKIAPRRYSPLGLFACYDGNLIGGALLGIGMAVAGSCPGTVLAQVGAGIPSGLPALAGGILAGIMWAGSLRQWVRTCPPPLTAGEKEQTFTVDKMLGTSQAITTAAFEALLAAVVAGLTLWTTPGPAARVVLPIVGGLLIGLAQLVSLVLRRTAVGVSTAYEEAGDLLWWLLGSSHSARPKGTSGIVAGAWALSTALPAVADVPPLAIPAAQSVLGGFLMVLGARVAGGCTSGHGITGMALLSLSSFVTIGWALAAGVLTAKMFLP
jgi:uncharacterized membrane protein YedE/YeeE